MANEDDAAPDDGITATGVEAPEEGTTEADEGQQQLESLRKQLNDTKRKMHELAQENAEFRGRIEGMTQRQPEQVADFLDEYTEEALMANPGLSIKALRELRESLLNDVAGVLRQERTTVQEQLRQFDPERVALRADIEDLKQDPDYAKLPDEALIVIARKARQSGGESGERRPPGALPGQRRGGRVKKETPIKETDLFRLVYGDQFDEKDKK